MESNLLECPFCGNKHVVEITRGFGKMDGLYSYTIKVVDDQYSTNKLGIV